MTLWSRVFEEHRGVLVPLGVALLVNVVVLAAAVVPLRSSVRTAEARSIAAMRDLADARRLERQTTVAQTSKRRADDELDTFYTKVLPPNFQAAETTTNLWLAQAAQAAGLAFKASHFDWNDVRESVLSRASARITLEGSYANIRRFLHSVETAEEFIIVERVELADPGDQPGATGQLQVSMIVSTYFLTSPSS